MPAVQTGISCGDTIVGRHRFGQLKMVRRAQSEQIAEAVDQDCAATVFGNSAQAPYRVVNFYHLIDIKNPYQVSITRFSANLVSGRVENFVHGYFS